MSDYTKATDFAAKDGLASGNPSKKVSGTEIDTEFNSIATAVATKQDDVITTRGDIIRGSSSAVAERLALGTSGQYLKSDGTDISWGALTNIVQVVTASTSYHQASSSSVPPSDDTIPQFSELTSVKQSLGVDFTFAITPNHASNTILVYVNSPMQTTTNGSNGMGLFYDVDSYTNCLAYTRNALTGNTYHGEFNLLHSFTAGQVSAITFKLGIGAGGICYLHGDSGTRLYGGVMKTQVIVAEIRSNG